MPPFMAGRPPRGWRPLGVGLRHIGLVPAVASSMRWCGGVDLRWEDGAQEVAVAPGNYKSVRCRLHGGPGGVWPCSARCPVRALAQNEGETRTNTTLG